MKDEEVGPLQQQVQPDPQTDGEVDLASSCSQSEVRLGEYERRYDRSRALSNC